MNPELKTRRFGVVIPAYQASASLSHVLEDVSRFLVTEKILVVDDGSTDSTFEIASRLGVSCVRHETNRGKGTALMTGMLDARQRGWEWAITLDADGQHSLEDLGKFLDARPGSQTGILVGTRPRAGTGMPLHRRFSNAFTTWLVSLMAGGPVFDAQSGFRAYRLDLLDAYPREGRFEWEAQSLILCRRRRFEVEAIPIRTVYSGQGSHMRLGRDTLRFLRMYGKLVWTR